ncbi:MAG: helix-turn-helix domain-containing protein [Telluria sp.]
MSKNLKTLSTARWFNQGAAFVCVPVELVSETRLSEAEIRILLALASHAYRDDTVWPSRARMVELTGLHQSTISAATTRLHEFGWIRKERKGYRGSRYTLLPRGANPA